MGLIRGAMQWTAQLPSALSISAAQSGSGLLEFALTVPIVLWLLFGTIDLGLATFNQSVINNAAREGARFAILGDPTAEDVINHVENFTVGLNPDRVTINVNYGDGAVTVGIDYDYVPLTPFIAQLLRAPECSGDECDHGSGGGGWGEEGDSESAIVLSAVSRMRQEGVD
jgi:hypothetical protein